MNIGYIRVSTKDQSTARQLDGIALDLIFEEKISGVLKDRPKLNECLIALRKGDTLHVHSIDRLARSIRNLLEIIDKLKDKGVTLHSHKENLIISADESNPFASMQLKMIAIFAEFERDVSKERQREGIAMTKIHGTKSGKPFGNQPLDMSRKDEAIKLCDQGMSISAIAKQMKLSRPSINKLLSGHTKQITY